MVHGDQQTGLDCGGLLEWYREGLRSIWNGIVLILRG